MNRLASRLEAPVGRPAIEQTGFAGAFDRALEWTSDLGLRQPPRDAAGGGMLTPDGVSLFTALQEQLGCSCNTETFVIWRVSATTAVPVAASL